VRLAACSNEQHCNIAIKPGASIFCIQHCKMTITTFKLYQACSSLTRSGDCDLRGRLATVTQETCCRAPRLLPAPMPSPPRAGRGAGHPRTRGPGVRRAIHLVSAAYWRVWAFHRQWCARAQFSTVLQVPARSGGGTSKLIPRAVVLPKPLQHLRCPPSAARAQQPRFGSTTMFSSHGKPCSRAHIRVSGLPP
jgi:hypothetical protein